MAKNIPPNRGLSLTKSLGFLLSLAIRMFSHFEPCSPFLHIFFLLVYDPLFMKKSNHPTKKREKTRNKIERPMSKKAKEPPKRVNHKGKIKFPNPLLLSKRTT
jgi:hypothetical protein